MVPGVASVMTGLPLGSTVAWRGQTAYVLKSSGWDGRWESRGNGAMQKQRVVIFSEPFGHRVTFDFKLQIQSGGNYIGHSGEDFQCTLCMQDTANV